MKDSGSSQAISEDLTLITRQFLKEFAPSRQYHDLAAKTSLDKDLGIDSLGRVELFSRVENHFSIRLTEETLAKASTLHDLIQAIVDAKPVIKHKQATQSLSLDKAEVDISNAQSLVDALYLYAEISPDRPHLYFQDEDDMLHTMTYGKLFESAKAVANGLIQLGLKKHDTVAIMLPTCEEFFYAFMGTLLAGGIPVPIYPPFRPDQISEYAMRESLILQNAETRILITFPEAEIVGKLLKAFIQSLKATTTVTKLMQFPAKKVPKPKLDASNAALIQYTSGSTSAPKGVLLSHGNLIANINCFTSSIQLNPNDLAVSWLPLYHDMGLIGTWLGSFYRGVPIVIMSPLHFLSRPERWLWAIHYHRGTLSGGPNFAYELCVNKVDNKDIEGLDLSSWRMAFNGAEAVNPQTLKRFVDKFKHFGLREDVFFPAYGLAENCVALCIPKENRKPLVDKVNREQFENERIAQAALPDEKDCLEFVSCGEAIVEHAIRVVDKNNNELAARHVGMLQFQGPSAMQGYFRNEQASAAIYHDGWWDTGDLAYMANNEVYICGRQKDLIIKAGRNLHPEGLEETTNQVDGVRKGCAVAFGVQDQARGTEKLIIVAETQKKDAASREQISNGIIEKIMTVHGIPPDDIVLAPPRTIPKTSSGKLRRASCKQMYLQGELKGRAKTTWRQLLSLKIKSLWVQTKNFLTHLAKLIYTAYGLTVFAILFFITIAIIAILPNRFSRKVVRFFGHIHFALLGCRFKVIDKQNMQAEQPGIYVANHASFIDGLVLTIALPDNVRIVAKGELKKNAFLYFFIKKLGYLPIERFDIAQSLSDTQAIENTLKQNLSIGIFPEGTFSFATGILPFKLGAFQIAVNTQTPIYPIALCGTRQILRGTQLLLRPHRITVTALPALKPKSKEWSEVIRLRDQAREIISKGVGESPLNL